MELTHLFLGLFLAGLVLAVGAMLFGVTPADPWSVVAGATVLFVVALAAGFIPARRAASLNPLIALRRE